MAPGDDDREAEICGGVWKEGEVKEKNKKKFQDKRIKKAINKLKLRKTPGVDGIRATMLKCGGEIMADVWCVCQMSWKVGRFPEGWTLT